jgi:hypothetical protein
MEKRVKSFQITLSAMIMIAFLMMPLASNGQAGKANFSGTWTLNAEKSDFGQGQGQPPQGQPGQGQPAQGAGQGQRMGGFGGANFVAKQEANLLTVERTRPGQDGGQPTTTTSKYTLDGKESVNTTARGESKSIATWAADGKSLKIVTTSTFGERTMTSTEEWSLTSANSLSVKTTRPSQNGERVSTMVYDKK